MFESMILISEKEKTDRFKIIISIVGNTAHMHKYIWTPFNMIKLILL